MRGQTARKATVYAVTGLNTFVAAYAWGWLGVLTGVAVGTFLIWLTPNSPEPPVAEPLVPPADPWVPPDLP